MMNRMKKKEYHFVGKVSITKRKIVERGKIGGTNTPIHDLSF